MAPWLCARLGSLLPTDIGKKLGKAGALGHEGETETQEVSNKRIILTEKSWNCGAATGSLDSSPSGPLCKTQSMGGSMCLILEICGSAVELGC